MRVTPDFIKMTLTSCYFDLTIKSHWKATALNLSFRPKRP